MLRCGCGQLFTDMTKLKAHQIVTVHCGHTHVADPHPGVQTIKNWNITGKKKVDPLIRAAKKAYRASEPGKLQALLDEESRWKRKLTIASNKLAEARDAINSYSKELADRCMKEGK